MHNSFVRTLLWVFLDSMEISLSLESNNMLFNVIWCPFDYKIVISVKNP